MTKAKALELRKVWRKRVDRRPCKHRDVEGERGADRMSATYHCLKCGKEVFRILSK